MLMLKDSGLLEKIANSRLSKNVVSRAIMVSIMRDFDESVL